ncbi:hypothetical protein AKO1_008145 [Acrasis kona]|uniref:Uncharacterized protein n=1 Tax=Acrasis kona TaxID=1008807 RepID=A0AAW2YK38_9EUKA
MTTYNANDSVDMASFDFSVFNSSPITTSRDSQSMHAVPVEEPLLKMNSEMLQKKQEIEVQPSRTHKRTMSKEDRHENKKHEEKFRRHFSFQCRKSFQSLVF